MGVRSWRIASFGQCRLANGRLRLIMQTATAETIVGLICAKRRLSKTSGIDLVRRVIFPVASEDRAEAHALRRKQRSITNTFILDRLTHRKRRMRHGAGMSSANAASFSALTSISLCP